MKKFDSLMLKVFLYGLPVFVVLAVYANIYAAGAVDRDAPYAGFLNSGFFGFAVALWLALAVYLSIRLLASGPFREQVIARITVIRERDEREAHLTGKAARATLLTTLALLVLLFCLNSIQVSVYRLPPEKAVGGKTGMVTLGVGFDLLKNAAAERPDAGVRQYIFNYKGLPLSSSSIILILMAWQIASYNYAMRRLLK
jgi:hypothetical protein